MCIVVIKKSKNPLYAFFIGMNREEKYNKTWDKIDNHWTQLPDVLGYKDNTSGGTWFAYNKSLIAILINKESNRYEHLETRSNIVLKALQGVNNLNDAVENLSEIDLSKVKPFNLVLLSREEVVLLSNLNSNRISKQSQPITINEDLIMINRSFPNDFAERRIASNFDRFKTANEPEPLNSDWNDWEQILTEECVTETPSQENTLWLNSKEWGTLTSDIIVVPSDKSQPITIYHVKERN